MVIFLSIYFFIFFHRCLDEGTATGESSSPNIAKAAALCRAKRRLWEGADGDYDFMSRANSYHDDDDEADLDDYVLTGGTICET